MIDLSDTAHTLLAQGKGLLAADESTHTADARLAEYGIQPSAEMRRKDRDLFLALPGAEQYLSGVILYEETLSQKSGNGTPFPELLTEHGIIPGIKVDEGVEPFPGSAEESITKGLLGLPERLAAFRATYHTGFTKWRAVIRIEGDKLPTSNAIVENAKRLAAYARLAQEAGMVPLIEPEVLYAGTHSRMRSRHVLEETLKTVVEALKDQSVDFSGVIVKTAMALSGHESGRVDTPEEVAEDTIAALMSALPGQLAGVVFLSGGQTPDQATANLAAIARRAKELRAPWPMTFSYARALQEEALAVWQGKDENVAAARAVFLERLQKVHQALQGEG